jgi:hypothetical protein
MEALTGSVQATQRRRTHGSCCTQSSQRSGWDQRTRSAVVADIGMRLLRSVLTALTFKPGMR